MSASHWEALHRSWARLATPPQVSAEVLAGVRRHLSDLPGRVLVLGVTPGPADLGRPVTAIDSSERVARASGSGHPQTRTATVGDWLHLPFAGDTFAACVGDGSLNALTWPRPVTPLLGDLARVLRRGGRFVCRVFLTPDTGETITEVTMAARHGEIRRFQTLKFRLAMAIVAESGDPNVEVRAIHDAFQAAFPERDHLAELTGWDRHEIDTIDVYRASAAIYGFPTSAQCLAAIPDAFSEARLVAVGGYELAERYPLLVMERS